MQPLQQVEWFGNARGYNISYAEIGTSDFKSITIEDHTANSHILNNLEEYTQYQVIMTAFNDVGTSLPSPAALERTRESGNLFLLLLLLFCLTNYNFLFKNKKKIIFYSSIIWSNGC